MESFFEHVELFIGVDGGCGIGRVWADCHISEEMLGCSHCEHVASCLDGGSVDGEW